MKKKLIVGAILSSVVVAHGSSIQWNTGAGMYSGAEAPAQAFGALSGTDTNWNNSVADLSGTVVYSDGTAATGVTLDLGVGGGTTIDWNSNPSTYGPNAGTGIYGTELMGTWLYSKNNDLGARVSGLAAGTYDVYALVREYGEPTRLYDVGIGVADTNTITGLTISSIGDSTGVTAWTAGMNYIKQTVTVADSSDFITVIVDNTDNVYSTLEGIQVVAIPEPATFGLLAVFGGGMLFMRRRFKR